MKTTGFHLNHRAFYPWVLGTLLALSAMSVGAIAWQLPSQEFSIKDLSGLLLTLLAGLGAFVFFLYKQHIDETRLFMQLFKSFNERYDELNGPLSDILEDPENRIFRAAERKHLVDYFNLCAEEHMYFKAGYIDPSVWLAWRKGMRVYLEDSRIRKLLEDELKTGSYYRFSVEEILGK